MTAFERLDAHGRGNNHAAGRLAVPSFDLVSDQPDGATASVGFNCMKSAQRGRDA